MKKYKEAVKDESDSEDEDTSVTDETQRMKEYFKKSKIYKKYEAEKIKEQIEDAKAGETTASIQAMKQKYVDLMKKYGFVLSQVSKQNEIAVQMEEMTKKMPNEEMTIMTQGENIGAMA